MKYRLITQHNKSDSEQHVTIMFQFEQGNVEKELDYILDN